MNDPYYEYLKKVIQESDESNSCIKYLPDIFKTLSAVLDMDILLPEERSKVNAALAYIVVQNDVIPEEIYGTWGYIDDLFLGSMVLIELHSNHPEISKFWEKPEEFINTIKYCNSQSRKALEEKNMVDKVLEYSGLKF